MTQITLQVSLAPSDFKHVVHLLPHQLKVFGSQVDEILLTYDTHKSKGRFALNWDDNNAKMWPFLQKCASDNPKIRLLKINYSKAKNTEIARKYFNKNLIPAKDWRGGPFYTYFFGLNEAKNDYVFHIDSDMFFGGLSQTWMAEALELFESDDKILFLNPLPGPPKEDGSLIDQNYKIYKSNLTNSGTLFYKFNGISTRLFMVNKKEFEKNKIKTKIYTTKPREFLRAVYKNNPPFRLPEEILSDYLIQNSKFRIDFLGSGLGLWSLHPPYRTEKFYEDLPQIIQKIENGEIPDSQKGFYDIVDELVDWTEAKNKLKH